MNVQVRNWIMIGVIIALTVTVVGLLIFGITTHSEPGLMGVCWDDAGVAARDSACDSPEELKWSPDAFPLSVASPMSDSVIPNAIDLVNSQVGCTLLTWEPSNTNPDVFVILDDAILVGGRTHSGTTGFSRTSTGVMSAEVRTYNVTDPHLRSRTVVHELGHVLGLEHDPFETSIMFEENPESDEAMDFIRFTDSDTALLRGLYCNE